METGNRLPRELKLYVVPTPLGNLKDITARAAEVLASCEIVFCEDTRRTAILMRHLGAKARLERYNENNPVSVSRCVELALSRGKTALVSDGGTPAVSDPGWRLVEAAVNAGITVEALPGPCAAATALSGSGLPSGAFLFLGFLPRKNSKIERILAEAVAAGRPFIIYESPFRIIKLLEAVRKTAGDEARVALARELTKAHEEWIRGTAKQVFEALSKKEKILGEITLVVCPQRPE